MNSNVTPISDKKSEDVVLDIDSVKCYMCRRVTAVLDTHESKIVRGNLNPSGSDIATGNSSQVDIACGSCRFHEIFCLQSDNCYL